jgi:hypothetical protein
MASNLGFLEEVIPSANHWGCSSPAELASILAILVMAGKVAQYRILPKGAFKVRWATAKDLGEAWALIDQAQAINAKIEGGGNWQ